MTKNLKKRKNDNNVSLISVIGKVKEISDRDYEGRVYDHILTIFNKLSTKEKRTLLRGLINIVFIVEDKILLNSTDLDNIRNTVKNTSDVDTVNEVKNEVVDLKTTDEKDHRELKKQLERTNKMFVKIIVILFITLVILIVTILTEFSSDFYNTITENILKLMKFIVLF